MYISFLSNYTPAPPKGYTVLPLFVRTPVRPSVRLSVLPSVQDIFRRIFLSNYWWQISDIWSQSSYRYAILWEAFLDPSDSYFLFAEVVDFYTHWTYMLIFRWGKCDEKCAYMFNVYKNQLSRQTGSRNPTGPKTLPTIWYTYMTLVTKYQISAINTLRKMRWKISWTDGQR
jgi:hypothetical protein